MPTTNEIFLILQALLLATILNSTIGVSQTLSDIRQIESEQRDALYCIAWPSDYECGTYE